MGATAAGARLRLALDHHYSPAIAAQLRRNGHDVVAAVERGWERTDDEALLSICGEEARALLTSNVGDFATIARRWAAEGRHHAGLIFTADASLPRHRDGIGRYVALDDLLRSSPTGLTPAAHTPAGPAGPTSLALDELLRLHPDDDALRDRVHWLRGSAQVATPWPPTAG